MKYTDLLELEVMRHALGEMGHQILMGYHRGGGLAKWDLIKRTPPR